MLPIKDLGNGLVLAPIQDESDAAQFINLHQTYTGEGDICDRLIHHKPGVTLQDFFVVKDSATHKVVSTTCLLPWVANFDGNLLKVAMLEMVITHPDYRHRGLVRAQLDYFKRVVAERGFDFSVIQGIPFFYRQFGYGYALDSDRSISLPTRLLPDSDGGDAIRFRSPQPEDFAWLTGLYQISMSRQQISVQRSQADWEYLVDAMRIPLSIIESGDGATRIGYFWGKEKNGVLVVRENGIAALEKLPAILAKMKKSGAGEIEVLGNSADPLYRSIEALGGVSPLPYQWLVNVHSPANLLTRIASVFERRLAAAGLSNLSTRLQINFYREAVDLTIEGGKITSVENRGYVDTSITATESSDLAIPPDAFARLVLGYRDLDELQDAWPDLMVLPKSRHALDALFPRMSALILMPY